MARREPQMRLFTVVTLRLAVVSLVVFCIQFTRFPVEEESSGLRERKKASTNAASNNSCTIYMAPSSVKGIKSMGIYTVKKLSADQVIAQDGLSLAVIDYTTDPSGYEESDDSSRAQWISTWDEYWWGRGVTDQIEMEGKTVVDFKVGLEELPNHHCVLASLDLQNPDRAYNDMLVPRDDPGLGAFTYHMGREILVRKAARAGDELFLDYGHCVEDEDQPEWAARVVKKADYLFAIDEIIGLWDEIKKFPDLDELKKEEEEKLRHTFDSMVSKAFISILAENKRAANVMPRTYKELKLIMTKTTNLRSSKRIATSMARYIGSTPRSVEWIRSNGICVDSIAPGKSTIPHAGQGAIAQRRLRQGEVVAPAPMLHIVDREVLRMVGHKNNSKPFYQLLMNYCLGHSMSSLLLCPVTNAMIVNHCSLRTKDCGQRGPNAMYRWATGWDPNTAEWLNKSLEELEQVSSRVLSMEIVALRDIEEGEEVFMDYGIEWEEAWSKHLATWEAPVNDEVFSSYMSPTLLNEEGGPIEFLLAGDLRTIPVHTNLETGCIYWRTKHDNTWYQRDPDWKDHSDASLLDMYAEDDGQEYDVEYSEAFDSAYWPCVVVWSDDEKSNATYTVRILQSKRDVRASWQKKQVPHFIKNYPRNSIRYFNKPYTSDQHLITAFRHHVGLRDEIFPNQWKNRRV